MQLEQLTTAINYAEIGEAIDHELAGKMVKDFNDANPSEQFCFNIGRNVIEQIFAQPGCTGLRVYRAINEAGKQTLVYAGIDQKGNTIFQYPGVNEDGKLGQVEALIGDKTTDRWIW